MFMRIWHSTMGGYVHMRVFVGKGPLLALERAGDLCMTTEEFVNWRSHVERPNVVEFTKESASEASDG